MDKKVINLSTLTSIADAIREKEGSEDTIKVSDFAERIANLPSESDDSELWDYIDVEATFGDATFYDDDDGNHILVCPEIDGEIKGIFCNFKTNNNIASNTIHLGQFLHIDSFDNMEKTGFKLDFLYPYYLAQKNNKWYTTFQWSMPKVPFSSCTTADFTITDGKYVIVDMGTPSEKPTYVFRFYYE